MPGNVLPAALWPTRAHAQLSLIRITADDGLSYIQWDIPPGRPSPCWDPVRGTGNRFIARIADLSAYANLTTYPDEFLHHHYRPTGTPPYLLIFIRLTSHTVNPAVFGFWGFDEQLVK